MLFYFKDKQRRGPGLRIPITEKKEWGYITDTEKEKTIDQDI